MKSRFLLLFLPFALFLSSCSSLPKGCLDYQNSPFSAEAVFREGGTEYVMQLEVTDPDDYAVRFTSPAPLNGFAFVKENGGSFVEFGGIKIPTGAGAPLGVAERTLSLLFLKKSDIKEISSERLNGIEFDVIVFKTPYGTAKLFADAESGAPVCIETEGGEALRIDFRFFADRENEPQDQT